MPERFHRETSSGDAAVSAVQRDLASVRDEFTRRCDNQDRTLGQIQEMVGAVHRSLVGDVEGDELGLKARVALHGSRLAAIEEEKRRSEEDRAADRRTQRASVAAAIVAGMAAAMAWLKDLVVHK